MHQSVRRGHRSSGRRAESTMGQGRAHGWLLRRRRVAPLKTPQLLWRNMPVGVPLAPRLFILIRRAG